MPQKIKYGLKGNFYFLLLKSTLLKITPLNSNYHCTRGYRQPRRLVTILSHFSRVQLFVTLWSTARQAPPSMGFSRLEYWIKYWL